MLMMMLDVIEYMHVVEYSNYLWNIYACFFIF